MRKGKTNNPNGRPKGSPNKVTSDVKAFISDIIEENKNDGVHADRATFIFGWALICAKYFNDSQV